MKGVYDIEGTQILIL